MINRRHLLSSLVTAGATVSFAGMASALTPAIGAIRVDVSNLARQGWGENVAWIKAGLERELQVALAPALQRGGPAILTVTVNSITMPSYAGGGGGGRFGDGGSSNDNLDSVATLTDRRGAIIATYPILSTQSSGYAGAWYLPDIDRRRIESLLQNNAGWIRRYVLG